MPSSYPAAATTFNPKLSFPRRSQFLLGAYAPHSRDKCSLIVAAARTYTDQPDAFDFCGRLKAGKHGTQQILRRDGRHFLVCHFPNVFLLARPNTCHLLLANTLRNARPLPFWSAPVTRWREKKQETMMLEGKKNRLPEGAVQRHSVGEAGCFSPRAVVVLQKAFTPLTRMMIRAQEYSFGPDADWSARECTPSAPPFNILVIPDRLAAGSTFQEIEKRKGQRATGLAKLLHARRFTSAALRQLPPPLLISTLSWLGRLHSVGTQESSLTPRITHDARLRLNTHQQKTPQTYCQTSSQLPFFHDGRRAVAFSCVLVPNSGASCSIGYGPSPAIPIPMFNA
jgi:hypothetical protein